METELICGRLHLETAAESGLDHCSFVAALPKEREVPCWRGSYRS
jgi:hypothetical protein